MSDAGGSSQQQPARRAPAANFDQQLFNLRQRLAGSSGVRPPPAEVMAPVPRQTASAPASGSSLTAANLARAGGGKSVPMAIPHEAGEMTGAPPKRKTVLSSATPPTAVPSALLGFFATATPKESAPSAEQASSGIHPREYLRAAVEDFAAACTAIDDFEYDADAEADRQLQDQIRKATADPSQPLPRFAADPFDFRVAQTGANGAAGGVSGVNRRTVPVRSASEAVGDESRTTVAPSESGAASGVASVVSTAAVYERERQRDAARKRQTASRITSSSANSDLYALPEDVARRHNVRPSLDVDMPSASQRRTSSSTRRGSSALSKAPSPPPGSSKRPPPPSAAGPSEAVQALDFSSIRQIKFRDPAIIVPVYDGRIAFCAACHRVVIGSGRGRCPHCGHVNVVSDVDRDDSAEEVAREAVTEAGLDPAADSGAEVVAARQLGPNATVAEIEAEERRQFQAAVAAWRSGKGVVVEGGTDDEPKDPVKVSTAFERSVALAARDVRLRSASGGGGGGSALYFQHLWHAAFPAHADGGAA